MLGSDDFKLYVGNRPSRGVDECEQPQNLQGIAVAIVAIVVV